MRRAESTAKAKLSRTGFRFEIDRKWVWRGCLALAVIGFILVLAKASMLLFEGGNKRLERHERANDPPSAQQAVSPATPSTPR